MRRRGFAYFFRRSVSQRKGRVFIAALSVMLAVAIVTGLLGITSGIREKLGSELKAYGANLLVMPEKGDYLDYDTIAAVSSIAGIEHVSGQVFGRAFIHKESVEIIGLDMDRMKETGWRLLGNWPGTENEILAGVNIKEALKIEQGGKVSLQSDAGTGEFTVTGFIERGGPEDKGLILSLPQAWALTGIDKKLSVLLVRGESGDLAETGRRIKSTVPGAGVKTLRQIAVAEETLLGKIQMLLVLVTFVVLFAAVVSIMSTMGANVLERREEIGLMKALGATGNNVRSFYFAEAVLIGMAGGVAGFILGYLFTQAVSWGAFHSLIEIPFYLVIVSVAAGLAISLAASHFPVRDALRFNAAVILREE